MYAGVSLDQAPPEDIPFRFFLTAPIFGVMAGLLIAFNGESLFSSSWDLEIVALTHVITLGWLASIMIGAFYQPRAVIADTTTLNTLDDRQLSAGLAEVIKPGISLSVIKNDPSDNKILECALKAKAACIVTGDKAHLLPLKVYKGIKILSPSDFLRL